MCGKFRRVSWQLVWNVGVGTGLKPWVAENYQYGFAKHLLVSMKVFPECLLNPKMGIYPVMLIEIQFRCVLDTLPTPSSLVRSGVC